MRPHAPLLFLVVACTVWGCVAEPVAPLPRPEPPPLPDTNVYLYPGYDPTVAGGGVSADVARNKRADYMRAQAACLDARGYSVK